MAANHITFAQFNFEGPTSPASFGIHYKETVAFGGAGFAVRGLAKALILALKSPIVGVLANDWHLTSISVQTRSVQTEPYVREDVFAGLGLRAGPSLPANMSWFCKQSQATFPPKSNGRVFIPGLGEQDSIVGVLTNVFLTGQAQALSDALVAVIAEGGGGPGRWTPGIISRKVLNFGPPPKDWVAAFAPIESMTPWPIISSQRQRVSRVIGAQQV